MQLSPPLLHLAISGWLQVPTSGSCQAVHKRQLPTWSRGGVVLGGRVDAVCNDSSSRRCRTSNRREAMVSDCWDRVRAFSPLSRSLLSLSSVMESVRNEIPCSALSRNLRKPVVLSPGTVRGETEEAAGGAEEGRLTIGSSCESLILAVASAVAHRLHMNG